MPAVPFFPASDTRGFGTALFLSPHLLPIETQKWIANTVHQTNNRLNITTHDMLQNFEKENISAVGFVWSNNKCGAFGCLQYYDWLNSGTPQMWLSDLCRFGPKLQTSPIPTLLELFRNCLLSYEIHELWLMVEQGEGDEILCNIYEGYGFERIQENQTLRSIFMRKKYSVL